MILIEVRPVNPYFSSREFVRFDRLARIWREIEDGGWNALLDDGMPVVIHPNSWPRLEAELDQP